VLLLVRLLELPPLLLLQVQQPEAKHTAQCNQQS
jgi:hypothetical protein